VLQFGVVGGGWVRGVWVLLGGCIVCRLVFRVG